MEVDRQPTTDLGKATERRRRRSNYENEAMKSDITEKNDRGRSSSDMKTSRTRSSSIRRYEAYRDLIMDESNSVGASTRSSSVILPLSKLNVKQLYGQEIFKHKENLDSPEMKSIAHAEKLKDSIESPTTSFSQIQNTFKFMRKIPTDDISEISGERCNSMDNSAVSQEARQDVVTKDVSASEKAYNNRTTIPRVSNSEKQTITLTDTSGESTQYTTPPKSRTTVRPNSRSTYLRKENLSLETQRSVEDDHIDRNVLPNGYEVTSKGNDGIDSPKDSGTKSMISPRSSHLEDRQHLLRKDRFRKEKLSQDSRGSYTKDYIDQSILPNECEVVPRHHQRAVSSNNSGVMNRVSPRSSNFKKAIDRTIPPNESNTVSKENERILSPSQLGLTSRASSRISQEENYEDSHNLSRKYQTSGKEMINLTTWDNSKKDYIDRKEFSNGSHVISKRHERIVSAKNSGLTSRVFSRSSQEEIRNDRQYVSKNDQKREAKRIDSMDSSKEYIARRFLPDASDVILRNVSPRNSDSTMVKRSHDRNNTNNIGYDELEAILAPQIGRDLHKENDRSVGTKEKDATISETRLNIDNDRHTDNDRKELDHQITIVEREKHDHKQESQDEQLNSTVSQSANNGSLRRVIDAENESRNVHDETVMFSTHVRLDEVQDAEKMAQSHVQSHEDTHKISPGESNGNVESSGNNTTPLRKSKKQKKKKEKTDTKQGIAKGESKESMEYSVKDSYDKSQCNTSDHRENVSDVDHKEVSKEQEISRTATDSHEIKQEQSTDSPEGLQEAKNNLRSFSENSYPGQNNSNNSGRRAYNTIEHTAALSGPEFAVGNIREEYEKINSHSMKTENSVSPSESVDSPALSTNNNPTDDELVQNEMFEGKRDNLNQGDEEERSQQVRNQKEGSPIESEKYKADFLCDSEEDDNPETIENASEGVQSSQQDDSETKDSSQRDTTQADFWAKCSIIAASAIMRTNNEHKEELAQKASETVLLNCTIEDDDQWISRLDEKLQSMSAQVALSIMLHRGGTRELASLTSLAVIKAGSDLAVQQFGLTKDDAEKSITKPQSFDLSESSDKSENAIESACESKDGSESLDDILGREVKNDNYFEEGKRSILDEESSDDEDNVPSELDDIVSDLFPVAHKPNNTNIRSVLSTTGSVCSLDTARVCNRTSSTENDDDNSLKLQNVCNPSEKETIQSTAVDMKNHADSINHKNTEQLVNHKNEQKRSNAGNNESLACRIRRIQRRAAEKQKKKTNEKDFLQPKKRGNAHHTQQIVWNASELSFVDKGRGSVPVKTERELKLIPSAEDLILNKTRDRMKQMPSHVDLSRHNFDPPPFVQLQISFDNSKSEEKQQPSFFNESQPISDTFQHFPSMLEESNVSGMENQTTKCESDVPITQCEDENSFEYFENVEIFLDEYDGYNIKVGEKEAKKINLSPDSELEIPSTIDLPNTVEIQVPQEILADDVLVTSGKGPCRCHGERRFPFKKSLRKVFSKRKKQDR